MKRFVFIALSLMAFVFTGCRSSFPASSEKVYQECVGMIKANMEMDGYIQEGQSYQGGYHDKETYSFSNQEGEKVQFTLEVHRGENNGNVYIDEVNVTGCSTTDMKKYEKYCGEKGMPAYIMKYYLKKDMKGSKFSPGKTVWAVIGGSFALGVLLGLLQASTNTRL